MQATKEWERMKEGWFGSVVGGNDSFPVAVVSGKLALVRWWSDSGGNCKCVDLDFEGV